MIIGFLATFWVDSTLSGIVEWKHVSFRPLALLLPLLLLLLQLGAEEGEELAGTPLGAAGGGAGVSKGVGASSGLGSDTAAGVATVAVAESGGAAAGPSRAQLQKMRRRAKQEVLKIDKQRRIELVKQGKSAYELRALAAAEVSCYCFCSCQHCCRCTCSHRYCYCPCHNC